MLITKDNNNSFTFNESTAVKTIKKFGKNGILKEDLKLIKEASFVRSDIACFYLTYYGDCLNESERDRIFNILLNARDYTLKFMKKGVYLERERLKFQYKLRNLTSVFFKYLNKFPELLREEEKYKFYQDNKDKFISNHFRNDFNSMVKIFKNQINEEEIMYMIKKSLKLRGRNGKFLFEVVDYVEKNNNINISQETLDRMIAISTMDVLSR